MWRWLLLSFAACGFQGKGVIDDAAATGDGPGGDTTIVDDVAPPIVDAPPDTPIGCDAGPERTRKITFANGSRAENLDGFPVSIAIPNSTGAGDDLRFEDPDGTVLPHEVEHWTTGGTSYVWVRVPRIDASSNADYITMRYGTPSVGVLPDPAMVWGPDHVGVWHFDGSSVGQFGDSTAMPSNASNNMPGQVPSGTMGEIGAAVAFDGTDDHLTAPTKNALSVTTLTLEAWVRVPTPTPAGWGAIVEHGRNTNNWYGLWRSGDIANHFHCRWTNGGTAQTVNFTGTFQNDKWHYVACTVDNGAHVARTYQDGTLDHETTGASASMANNQPLMIGSITGGGEVWKGGIDELRVSRVARSAAWISAQHASMSGTFATIGPETDECD